LRLTCILCTKSRRDSAPRASASAQVRSHEVFGHAAELFANR
jgi:hypothetical protein